MTGRPVSGLQGWLVGALLAVGMCASVAVLLTVLPTLESAVSDARAKRDAGALATTIARYGREPEIGAPPTGADIRRLADRIRANTGAEVSVSYRGSVLMAGSGWVSPPNATLLSNAHVPVGQAQILGSNDAVAAAAPLVIDGVDVGVITAALPLSGVAPELAIVRRRVILAMIVVLGLAALAGIALARLLGSRIRRLAGTAATLAAGDLSARAPEARIAPQEIVTLGESLNGMAGRLQDLVAEITSERDRDRAMIGSLAEGVIAVAPDGTVAVANDAANHLLGLPEGAESARLDALPAPILDAVLAARLPNAAPGERRLVALPNGIELELHVAPLADDHAAGTVITMRDVTEERRLERARRDLVANVSHELKTPIAALKGFLELLESEGVDARTRQEFLASMTQETARLERLVEEQLQLARLDSGALPLEPSEVELDELARVVVNARVPLAARAGVSLSSRRTTPDAVTVRVDPARIEQILLILLDNAQRHTPRGGRVEVVVGREDDQATLAVTDTGEGIPEDDQPFVFDRFYRGDASREGRSAGLGLAIARGLAAAHRGGIDLRSRVGEGSTFTLRLPLAGAEAAEREQVALGA